MPLIPAGKTAAIISRSVLTVREIKARQASVKVMKQGQSLIEGLTHKFASFDFGCINAPFGDKSSQITTIEHLSSDML